MGAMNGTLLAALSILASAVLADDVYVRFNLVAPRDTDYSLQLGGFIHITPWRLPRAPFPKDPKQPFRSGTPTPWFNLTDWAGDKLHAQQHRAGGVAEFPNVTVDIKTANGSTEHELIVELATAPDAGTVKKRWQERFTGSQTSFLVSPNLAKDAALLENAMEMSARRLCWAREATRGKRVSPEHHIIQTSLWSAQRPELNLKEAEVLWLLGFNVLGNPHAPIPEKYGFRLPGHTHRVAFGPAATRDEIDALMKGHAAKLKKPLADGVPFGFADEIAARPRIGDNAQALKHFAEWLTSHHIDPKSLGAARIEEVVPIETPDVLRERMKTDEAATRRIFYYTSRFRQLAGTQRIRWHTEAFHRYFGDGPLTTSLVADHPYFGGTGLGMGMKPDMCWGNHALALDWFDLVRNKAVDLIGIEDWMGLQYMYGPHATWEGFQLMGFQAAMMRSGSRQEVPIIAWITPSDETNVRLKSASALCQGAKHFFYWTYGPTCTSTENYWSDLRGEYDGIAAVTRHLTQCGETVAKGRTPATRLALLYSISSDLWQPFDYLHMLERRCTYLSLVHDQYLVDFVTEEDVETGRLGNYDVLYTCDPCITAAAMQKIREWVKGGGRLHATCAAGSRNAFGETVPGLADVFGIHPQPEVELQPGRYRVRGALNAIPHLDQIRGLGVIGMKATVSLAGGKVVDLFKDGSPAIIEHVFGKGRARYVAATPGVSYAKDARFVPKELKEQWPAPHRALINTMARNHAIARPVRLSHPVVEAGLYVHGKTAAVVLANFTYQPIDELRVTVPLPFRPRHVLSSENGSVDCTWTAQEATVDLPLGISDIIIFRE